VQISLVFHSFSTICPPTQIACITFLSKNKAAALLPCLNRAVISSTAKDAGQPESKSTYSSLSLSS
jgi:hypothetical protein